MSLVRNSITIGGLTLVSRVLGLLRDMLMARYVGAGLASDAFLIAWRLPNLFRALFAEGAFAAVFVPLFNKKMTEAEREKAQTGLTAARTFASQVLSVLFPFLVLFTGVMMLAAGIGSEVTIDTEGDQAQEALDAVLALIADKFGEGE